MKLTGTLLDLLFPPKCPFCRRVLDAPGMCPECEKTLPWTDEAHSLRELRGGLLCAAPLWYEGPVREAVRRFKFHGGVCAAGPLGELIAQAAAERLSGEFDTVAWVPVSAKRLRKRGYDQSRLLAERACRLWDVEPEALLRKIRDNPAQSSLERAGDRWKNTQGVYEAAGSRRGSGFSLLTTCALPGPPWFPPRGSFSRRARRAWSAPPRPFPGRRRKRGEKKGKNRLAFWRDCQYNVLCNFMDTLAVIRLS